MRKILWAALPLALAGCAAQGALSAAGGGGGIGGEAAGLFGIPAATVATQVGAEIGQIASITAQLQMLKAQLDGTPMPTLPTMAGGTTTAVPIVPPGTPTGTITTGPVVTPTGSVTPPATAPTGTVIPPTPTGVQ
jgi:hypothetical protein